jgi:hypothetical protein
MEPDLIDRYLAELRRSLRWCADIDDLAEEVEGHLREASSRLVTTTGVGPAEAQRRTLACFGEVGLVARSFATARTGGLAVPTRATRACGALGMLAAGCWLVACLLLVVGGWTTGLLENRQYPAWSVVTALATALAAVVLLGMRARAGLLRTPGTAVAMALVGLSVVGAATVAWGWAFALLPLAAAFAVAATGMTTAGLPNRWAHTLLIAAWPVGLALVILGDEVIGVGPTDSYGDHPHAYFAAFWIAALMFTAGLASISMGLRREEPADLPHVVPLNAPLAP